MDDDARWRLLYLKKLEVEIAEAFGVLRNNGVEPLLIKGWAAARNYPVNVQRFCADVDLAVSAADFEVADRLLRANPERKLCVDLHRELRHLDTRPWSEVFGDSREIDLNSISIRIPADEDHLRVLVVHWLNDGGERKDRLWDIYYAIQNRLPDFDWDLCLNSVSEVRRGWIVAVIGLANLYLGLDIDDLPFAARAKELPPWLVSALDKEWQSGVPLKSLHMCLSNPKELLRQIRKRIPPNPIQATIESEGSFDNRSRLKYQLASMVRKFGPSIKGIRKTLAQQ